MTFAQKAGWTLVATALDGAADLRDFTYPQKTLLIMGSEAEGVSHSLLEKKCRPRQDSHAGGSGKP